MNEPAKALIFSDGQYRFTVTREALEKFMALSESGIDGSVGVGLRQFVEEVMQTVEKEDDLAWEGEAYVDNVGRVRFLDPDTGEVPWSPTAADKAEVRGEMFYPGLAAGKGSIYGLQGRRVTVRILRKAADLTSS